MRSNEIKVSALNPVVMHSTKFSLSLRVCGLVTFVCGAKGSLPVMRPTETETVSMPEQQQVGVKKAKEFFSRQSLERDADKKFYQKIAQ